MFGQTQRTSIGRHPTRWLAVFSMLAGLALPGLLTGKPAAREEQAAKAFHVIASRFRFEPAAIEVDEGDRVRLTLTSADVTHSLAIKTLKVKAVIPEGGEEVTVEFVADKPGSFSFACSEYCGSGHGRMKGRLVVNPKPR
jgi:heme/copper-type cytochrome/quinol oxidase subunit 2